MELRLNEHKMEKINLSVPEILMLKSLDDSITNNYSLADVLESLQKEGYVCGFANDNITFLTITNIGQMILNRMLEEKSEEEKVSEQNERLAKIADAMRELYPKGCKKDDMGNDAYPWKDSTNAIVERLRRFEEKYYDGNKLDFDKAVSTTKRYVESCKRRDPVLLRPMKTLSYFIYKNEDSLFRKWLDADGNEEIFDESNGMTIL